MSSSSSSSAAVAAAAAAAASASPEKIDWLVILPDHDGVLTKRMEIRASHLSAIKPLTQSGFWKMGGAMLEEVPREGEGLKIMGSAMMAHAATKEEVLEVIKQDIYFKNNIWNLDKVQIYPVSTGQVMEVLVADSFVVQNCIPQPLSSCFVKASDRTNFLVLQTTPAKCAPKPDRV